MLMYVIGRACDFIFGGHTYLHTHDLWASSQTYIYTNIPYLSFITNIHIHFITNIRIHFTPPSPKHTQTKIRNTYELKLKHELLMNLTIFSIRKSANAQHATPVGKLKLQINLFISTEINVYSHKSQHGGMNFSSRALIRAEGRAFGVLSVNKKPKSTGTTRQHSSPALPD